MRKNVKKLAVVFLAVCLCMTALVGCKAKTDPDLWVENPSGVAAEDLTLSDEQMVAALTELARRTENQMLAVDPHAKVEFRVAEDGSCGFYAAGTEEDGTVSEEMEEISTAESVKAFFDSYYEAGFFDAEGNLLGFPEEVPDDELAQEQPDTDIQEILDSTEIEGGDGEIAGFPGEGRISADEAADVAEADEATADSAAVESASENN
jgi:hypothetical protein